MKRFLSLLLWIIIAGGVLYGGYLAYVKWWDPDLIQKRAEEAKSKIGRSVKDATGEYVEEAQEAAKNTIQEFLKRKASEALQGIGTAFQSGAESISGTSTPTMDIQSGGYEAPKGDAYFSPPPPAAIITRVGELLSFSINKKISYDVQWGDGKKDSGETHDDSVSIVSHAWEKEGDYVVTMTIRGEKTETTIFPVRVYPR